LYEPQLIGDFAEHMFVQLVVALGLSGAGCLEEFLY
jgi:hypothetical protein